MRHLTTSADGLDCRDAITRLEPRVHDQVVRPAAISRRAGLGFGRFDGADLVAHVLKRPFEMNPDHEVLFNDQDLPYPAEDLRFERGLVLREGGCWAAPALLQDHAGSLTFT